MKRHLLGLAVFGFVVVGFGIGFAIFDRIEGPNLVSNNAVTVVITGSRPLPRSSDMTVRLMSLYYDQITGQFVGQVQMRWDRTSPPPSLVDLEIAIATPDRPNDRQVIQHEWVKDPFASGSNVIHHLEWVDLPWGLRHSSNDPKSPNLYAHAAVPEETSGMTKAVIYEYNYLRDAVPVLIKHRDKK